LKKVEIFYILQNNSLESMFHLLTVFHSTPPPFIYIYYIKGLGITIL